MIKIAFIGAHSVGKTTVIDDFLNAHAGVSVVKWTNIPREIINRGFPLGKSSVHESWVNFIRDQFKAEHEGAKSGKGLLISDRTILDAAAYAYVTKRLPRPHIRTFFVEMLEQIWIREKEFYVR